MSRKPVSFVLIGAFLASMFPPVPKAQAQPLLGLPEPGAMVGLSPAYQPPIIRGITVHKDNPLRFDFILDKGDNGGQTPIKAEGLKLIKYFLAGLAIPEKDLWVNLSPYEKDRIVPKALGQTQMGRDLLAQDYMLKQISASLVYPERGLGKQFWQKLYKQLGTDTNYQVPVNLFNKIWIMADKAEVYEHNQTAFVVNLHLKVMLEEDYLAMGRNTKAGGRALGVLPAAAGGRTAQNIVRSLILPTLEQEVNTGKNFANLRQICNSLILASWYKKHLKAALLNQVYSNQEKVKGIALKDQSVKEQIYERYLQAYKKGVFNFIKEEPNPAAAKKYFSGGFVEGAQMADPAVTSDPTALNQIAGIIDRLVRLGAAVTVEQIARHISSLRAPLLANQGLAIIRNRIVDQLGRENVDLNVDVNTGDGKFNRDAILNYLVNGIEVDLKLGPYASQGRSSEIFRQAKQWAGQTQKLLSKEAPSQAPAVTIRAIARELEPVDAAMYARNPLLTGIPETQKTLQANFKNKEEALRFLNGLGFDTNFFYKGDRNPASERVLNQLKRKGFKQRQGVVLRSSLLRRVLAGTSLIASIQSIVDNVTINDSSLGDRRRAFVLAQKPSTLQETRALEILLRSLPSHPDLQVRTLNGKVLLTYSNDTGLNADDIIFFLDEVLENIFFEQLAADLDRLDDTRLKEDYRQKIIKDLILAVWKYHTNKVFIFYRNFLGELFHQPLAPGETPKHSLKVEALETIVETLRSLVPNIDGPMQPLPPLENLPVDEVLKEVAQQMRVDAAMWSETRVGDKFLIVDIGRNKVIFANNVEADLRIYAGIVNEMYDNIRASRHEALSSITRTSERAKIAAALKDLLSPYLEEQGGDLVYDLHNRWELWRLVNRLTRDTGFAFTPADKEPSLHPLLDPGPFLKLPPQRLLTKPMDAPAVESTHKASLAVDFPDSYKILLGMFHEMSLVLRNLKEKDRLTYDGIASIEGYAKKLQDHRLFADDIAFIAKIVPVLKRIVNNNNDTRYPRRQIVSTLPNPSDFLDSVPYTLRNIKTLLLEGDEQQRRQMLKMIEDFGAQNFQGSHLIYLRRMIAQRLAGKQWQGSKDSISVQEREKILESVGLAVPVVDLGDVQVQGDHVTLPNGEVYPVKALLSVVNEVLERIDLRHIQSPQGGVLILDHVDRPVDPEENHIGALTRGSVLRELAELLQVSNLIRFQTMDSHIAWAAASDLAPIWRAMQVMRQRLDAAMFSRRRLIAMGVAAFSGWGISQFIGPSDGNDSNPAFKGTSILNNIQPAAQHVRGMENILASLNIDNITPRYLEAEYGIPDLEVADAKTGLLFAPDQSIPRGQPIVLRAPEGSKGFADLRGGYFSQAFIHQTAQSRGLELISQALDRHGRTIMYYRALSLMRVDQTPLHGNFVEKPTSSGWGVLNTTVVRPGQMLKVIVLPASIRPKVFAGKEAAMVAGDHAMVPGGIDLNTSKTAIAERTEGGGVQMAFDQAMVEKIKREGVENLTPVIYSITPIQDLKSII